MSVWGVVVARVSHGAKSRLGGVLNPAQRQELALAMLADVLAVCTSAGAPLDHIVAVVDTPEAQALARSRLADALLDGGADMNMAATAGIRWATVRGARTVVVLPGDVPLLTVKDLQALVAAASAPRSVVIGASRDGQGTNALLLQPPTVISPSFGPPSVDRHARLAHAAGATTHVLDGLDLALDVDTPFDLARLADLPVGPRTADFLALSDLEAFTRI
jgi:2-phospho-L-lactate/phosphoenolpyruvate guanylyltransferase